MSTGDEEPYSTIFASLKHPIRRRILRMLSRQPMSFSEILESLGVSNSFLTYHLENLGELVGKTEDGKYKLSSFGEAALSTMTKVEDMPSTPQKVLRTKPRRVMGISVAMALGIICILLIAGLGGTMAYYTLAIHDKDNTISSKNNQIASLNSQIADQNNTISSLNFQISQLSSNVTSLQNQLAYDNITISSLASNITNLQEQLNSLLNGSTSFQDIVLGNPSAWVNKTVIVEGSIDVLFRMTWEYFPYGFELSSNSHTIGVYIGSSVNVSVSSWGHVIIYGVIREGYAIHSLYGLPEVTYYIEAETVEPI